MSNDKRVETLTLIEKASMLVGYKTMSTLPIPEKGIESIVMSDGPNGLRIEDPNGNSLSGISEALPATCFPVGVTLASTWNLNLANKMGRAIGEEAIHYGINVVLGPAVNIQRNPLCGRNFEYLSEDPFIAGKTGSELVKGIQSQGVGACVKHYVCNNNEKYRFVGDSIVDDKALHEIYLKPYEIIVKESDPRAIMTAYNQVNGSFCSENKTLIEDELRHSWGFDGVVMTDWGGMVHRDIALNHGCDLEMPGMVDHNIKVIIDAVKDGAVKEETLNQSIERLLSLKDRTSPKQKIEADFNAHYKLALDIALEGAVLLKNDNKTLPLSKDNKYLVIGGLFSAMRYQGSGSSLLNPYIIKDHIESFKEKNINYEFALGYEESETEPNDKLELEALNKAKEYDTIIFYGGLNDYVESEGYDRKDMSIPHNQLSLLDKLSKLGKKIVVVLFNGSPIELPFFDHVDSILDMMLPGEAGGEATTKLLFGEVSPSGKLTQSWTYKYSDVPFSNEFASNPYELYKESIFVGYRNYKTLDVKVRFPFGYGLSYTSFEYSNLKVMNNNDKVLVTLKVENTGEIEGKDIIQLYVGKKDSKVIRPSLELKGFSKVSLKPGEEKEVLIELDNKYLSVFTQDGFKVEDGEYQLYIGNNVDDIRLSSVVKISGEKLEASSYDQIYKEYISTKDISKETFEKVVNRVIPEYVRGKRPYTMETPIEEFDTFFGKIFKKSVANVGLKRYKRAKKIKDPLLREREKKAGLFIYYLVPNNSLRSLSFSASGGFDYPLACGILELANGHLFKGLKAMGKKEKIKE